MGLDALVYRNKKYMELGADEAGGIHLVRWLIR